MRHAAWAAAAAMGVMVIACGGTPTAPSSVASDAQLVPGAALPPGPTVPSPAPVPGLPQIFVGAGDIAMCDANSEATARLVESIGGTVFTVGDNAYVRGTREEFRNCYEPTWGRFKSRTRPVPGNHDYETAGAAPYYEYFGPSAGPAGLGYYSFELGSWHAVALNSNIPVNAASAQAAWLRNDLAANPSRCTIAYWHHPLFSSGPDGPSPRMAEFWRILYASGAEIVLNGHEHYYERFGPQDSAARPDSSRGVREFIVGTGGAVLYDMGSPLANSERQIRGFGVLKLTLAADNYDWEFIPVSGPGDRGSGTCH